MTFASSKITYGEAAALEARAEFLAWMSKEGERIPSTRKDMNALLCRWLAHDRAEKMRYVSELRVKRGQPPLPAWLTRAPKCHTCDGDGNRSV